MSDGYQTLAFDTVAADRAQATVDAALRWMKASGFVLSEAADCTLDGPGFRPGPNWRQIVDGSRCWRGLPSPGGAPEYFLTLAVNGVSAQTGRIVCQSAGNLSDFRDAPCPACGAQVELEDLVPQFAGTWYDAGAAAMPCPRCAVETPLQDWDLQPHWAFADAALTFWNWPAPSESFTSELTGMLAVPRLRHIVGHL